MHKVYSNIAGDAQSKLEHCNIYTKYVRTLQHIRKVYYNNGTVTQNIQEYYNRYTKQTRPLHHMNKVNKKIATYAHSKLAHCN